MNETVKIIWEFCKVVVPSLLAWYLAIKSAQKSAKDNRDEMREQLEISKTNAGQVQSRAYKLQFCITELEKHEVLVETTLDYVNSFISAMEAVKTTKSRTSIGVVNSLSSSHSQAARKMLNNFGVLDSVINAANPDSMEAFTEKVTALQNSANSVIDHFNEISEISIRYADGNLTDMKHKIIANYDRDATDQYEKDLHDVRDFILEHIDIIFRKMNRGV